ncbi:hypothetical protein LguiA_027921 [Lonicera macranthoides]
MKSDSLVYRSPNVFHMASEVSHSSTICSTSSVIALNKTDITYPSSSSHFVNSSISVLLGALVAPVTCPILCIPRRKTDIIFFQVRKLVPLSLVPPKDPPSELRTDTSSF